MLSYKDILPKKYIVLNGKPHEVLSAHVFRKQQRKPVNQTTLRGLQNGKTIDRTFHQSESVEEAELKKRTIRFLYKKRDEYWFSDKDNPRDRFCLSPERVRAGKEFLKEHELVEALVFKNAIIVVKLPVKVELRVVEAPPSLKGDTAQGGTKQVTLESGAVVSVPLFINEGDIIRINTETGIYTERAEKT